MSGMQGTDVVQITNLSSAVSSEQMRTLFGFLGDIEEFRLYPPDNAPLSFSSKVCYIKYREPTSVGVAQHLTNTVFIDRALIVVPCAEGKIPEEAKALSLLAPAPPVPTLMPGTGLLPIPTQSPIHTPQLSTPMATLTTLSASVAMDIGVSAVSAQAPLMGNVDPSKVDEIRRTVYVGNLNSQTTAAEQLLEFFKQVGDVKFVRMAGDETQPTRFAFVEFANQESVSRALTFNGVMFGDRPLKINHSNNAIVKPPELTPQAAAKELEDVMKRVREAQCTIAAAIEPADIKKRSSSRSGRSRRSHTKSPSRSRSQTHRRRSSSSPRNRNSPRNKPRVSDSRSSYASHRRRSHCTDQRHSRSRSRDSWKKQTESRKGKEEKKACQTPLPILKSLKSPLTSHLCSRGHRKRSRNCSRSPRRKARSPSPKRGKKDKRQARGQESTRERRECSSSRKKSSWEKDKKTERKDKSVKAVMEYKEKEDSESEREDLATPSQNLTSPCMRPNGSCRAHTEVDRAASADST